MIELFQKIETDLDYVEFPLDLICDPTYEQKSAIFQHGCIQTINGGCYVAIPAINEFSFYSIEEACSKVFKHVIKDVKVLKVANIDEDKFTSGFAKRIVSRNCVNKLSVNRMKSIRIDDGYLFYYDDSFIIVENKLKYGVAILGYDSFYLVKREENEICKT